MIDILPFIFIFAFIILQRVIELFVAKSNENWMKQQGAIEFGTQHYQYMVLMHLLFFVSFFIEKTLFNRGLSPLWPWLLFIFISTQLMRIWVITSLGRYWNIKIIVRPNADIIKKGPYRFIKHPNYFVVSIEIIVIPMLFTAYFTAFLFTVLNVIMLSIRIPEEEKALRNLTEYEGEFQDCNRFFPKFVK
ncbi:isoprenylcysteine carboxylmethyltransferase family protein [Neobacillus sp.]|uniref:isoprenylcysteine carboxyl methyltransferase family protein n=1 Tax=Neobacillus sp. TaxID=2675273 RepID=UPI00289BA29C|nr:isoprenylcysteine carboxylmethyltransferase family protein [Neobacillus sp.]